MNVFCAGGWLEALNTVVAGNLLHRVHLFQNNHVPVFTDTVANYTVATFSGYGGPVVLAWGAAFVNGANQGEIDAVNAVWTHNGGVVANTIYGIYVIDNAGNLLYAERFPAPISMSTNGDTITYGARTTLINQ